MLKVFRIIPLVIAFFFFVIPVQAQTTACAVIANVESDIPFTSSGKTFQCMVTVEDKDKNSSTVMCGVSVNQSQVKDCTLNEDGWKGNQATFTCITPDSQTVEDATSIMLQGFDNKTECQQMDKKSIILPLNQGENASSSTLSDRSKMDKVVGEVFDYVFSKINVLSPLFPSPSNNSGTESGSTSPANTAAFGKGASSLVSIFQEVQQKVGTPVGVLFAIMKIEYPSTFNLTPEQIQDYSTPGHTIPGCGPNSCSAAGPMQMSTGVDDVGNTSCGGCCDTVSGRKICSLTSCPNAWAADGTSVNKYGGYSHTPNYCNLRDNVYAAAAKLKRDSGATSGDWTKEEVYAAAKAYYGNCTTTYPGLGNKTYCEDAWDKYQQFKNAAAATSTGGTTTADTAGILDWGSKISALLSRGADGSFNRMTSPPSNDGYNASYRLGNNEGVTETGLYWCTNLVIDSYGLAGHRELASNPGNQSVIAMDQFWRNQPGYVFLDYANNPIPSLQQLKSGCAMFVESSPGVHTGHEHVALVKSVSLDENGNGTIGTLDANASNKEYNYPVYKWSVKNTFYGLVGFGCM